MACEVVKWEMFNAFTMTAKKKGRMEKYEGSWMQNSKAEGGKNSWSFVA